MKKRNMKVRMLVVLALSLGIVLAGTISAFALFQQDDVFSAGEEFFSDAQDFILTVSTPAAVIGVGIGALMKKFSMGDPQKIQMGGKVISGSIIGWAFINGLTLILDTISNYTG